MTRSIKTTRETRFHIETYTRKPAPSLRYGWVRKGTDTAINYRGPSKSLFTAQRAARRALRDHTWGFVLRVRIVAETIERSEQVVGEVGR